MYDDWLLVSHYRLPYAYVMRLTLCRRNNYNDYMFHFF